VGFLKTSGQVDNLQNMEYRRQQAVTQNRVNENVNNIIECEAQHRRFACKDLKLSSGQT